MENTENIKSAEDLTTPSKPPAPTVVIPEQKPTVSTQEPQQPQPQPQPPVLSPPDTAAPDPSSADDQSLAAKVKKGTNYSKEEIKKLLGLVQEGLPITDEEWEQLATKFNDGGSVKRTTASLR